MQAVAGTLICEFKVCANKRRIAMLPKDLSCISHNGSLLLLVLGVEVSEGVWTIMALSQYMITDCQIQSQPSICTFHRTLALSADVSIDSEWSPGPYSNRDLQGVAAIEDERIFVRLEYADSHQRLKAVGHLSPSKERCWR